MSKEEGPNVASFSGHEAAVSACWKTEERTELRTKSRLFPMSNFAESSLQVVVAKSFARIHWQNLICFGALPLTFTREEDIAQLAQGDRIVIEDVYAQLGSGETLTAHIPGKGEMTLHHGLSPRQRELITQGGVINHLRKRNA